MAFEVERMRPGEIAFLTQSGALGGSLLSRTWADGIGFSHWICAGNEADLTLSDYLDALVDDPDARVIAIFMETLRDPVAFLAAARRARQLGKPIVVYKTGESEVGRRAVRSHTGSLAGDNRVYAAAFRACGIARVDNLQALVDAAVALAWQPLPRGRRVGVISASGGACSVIADECARHGLELPLLPAGTVARIAQIVPPFGVSQNPVDVTIEITRNPGMIGQVAEIMLAEQTVDALVVLMTTNADPPALEVARGVARAAGGSDKPVLLARVGAEFLAPASIAYYRDARIPLVPMPDRVVRALRAMVDVSEGSGRATSGE
jgi:acyl-CoA synthetase (NDP forming)